MADPISLREARQAIARTRERLPYGPDDEPAPAPALTQIHWVKPTDTELDADGYQEAERYQPNLDEASGFDGPIEECLLFPPNGEPLSTCHYYPAVIGDDRDSDGLTVYYAIKIDAKFKARLLSRAPTKCGGYSFSISGVSDGTCNEGSAANATYTLNSSGSGTGASLCGSTINVTFTFDIIAGWVLQLSNDDGEIVTYSNPDEDSDYFDVDSDGDGIPDNGWMLLTLDNDPGVCSDWPASIAVSDNRVIVQQYELEEVERTADAAGCGQWTAKPGGVTSSTAQHISNQIIGVTFPDETYRIVEAEYVSQRAQDGSTTCQLIFYAEDPWHLRLICTTDGTGSGSGTPAGEWFCWQNGSDIQCSDEDLEPSGYTQLSGPYLSAADCAAQCSKFWCVQAYDCGLDNASCSGCTPAGSIACRPTHFNGDPISGVGDSVCYDSGGGDWRKSVVIDGPFPTASCGMGCA